ncbi:hypothetical protein AAG570_008910 [Ranatra chinensis]|uniref:Major facilitator superfamily (MFS) profile domain-containing protein n=1 Tax=Ranatra chinensis TaxID=642074 RepID=A0ABD0ZDF2_9HEMI
MLIPGTIKSFGVLFVEFIEVFEATPVEASWIPALCYFLYCSLGPLASYLSVKFSYRTVTLLGGVFASAGMILSYFASSIIYLYFSYGVLVGTGAGLSFPPGIFIVTSYFVKYRGFANGLAISGSAIGSIILPPFLRYLLENFGYRGAVLIMGGITLNVLVGALLYEPVQKHMKLVKVVKESKNESENEEKLLEFIPQKTESVERKDSNTVVVATFKPSVKLESECKERLIDNGSTRTRKISCGAGFGKSALSLDAGPMSRKVSSCSYRGGMGVGSTGHLSRKTSAYARPMGIGSTAQMTRNFSVASNMSSSSFRYVSTAFHGSTLVGLHPEFSSTLNIKPAKKSPNCFNCLRLFRSSKPEKKIQPKTESNKSFSIIILISNASNAIGYTNFTILVPSYAISIGFDKSQASYLLSVVAALDLVGRIGGSALSDFLKIDKKIYFVGGLLISGLSLAFLPFFTSYNNVAIFCAIFGLASGTYVGITAVIMVDMLGEELLASSYGISLFINGLLQLAGPPLCGLIYEQINEYGLIFNGLGLSLVIGAGVWGFVPLFKTKETY